LYFFFFQAEDGIRDLIVTGVQTCALPIWTQPVYECRERAVYPESRKKHEGLKRRYAAKLVESTVKRWIIALRTDPETALKQARLFAAETGERKAERRSERDRRARSEEHTSELQSRSDLVCRLLLEKKKQ